MKQLRAIFRYILFVASTLGIYALWFIASPFVSDKISWRQRIFRQWARMFVSISQMRIEISGTAPKPPFFLVCNHLSYTDIPALRRVVEGVFVAKGEIETWFLAGRIVRDMGAIFINRRNRRDIPRAGAEIVKRLEQGEGVIVFPEGTSAKGDRVLPFNSSFLEFAAQKNLPVFYAAVSYATPPDEPPASATVTWWDEKTFAEHLWYLFQVREFTATISFGDAPVQSGNRKELAQTLWKRVNEKFTPVQ